MVPLARLMAVAAAVAFQSVQLDLDCDRPAAARTLIARIMLSEIEWAEDVNRAAMWDAWGRCADAPRAESCREAQRERFGEEFARQKTAIEAKYAQMLADFTARCQASIARERGVVPFRPEKIPPQPKATEAHGVAFARRGQPIKPLDKEER